MIKKIKFIKQNTFLSQPWGEKVEINIPEPKKTSVYLPDWYSKSERWTGSGSPKIEGYSANQGLKHCVPFLDAMTNGYAIELWTDVQAHVDENGSPHFTWLSQPDPLLVRTQESGALIPRPVGHHDMHLAWTGQWGIKLPKGYSYLLTHPANRFDLPFTTLTGIVDADSYYAAGLIPFFIKENFEGIIKAGTPIAQIYPFKRDNWESELGDTSLRQETIQQSFDSRRSLGGLYKKLHWTRKEYK